MLQKTSPLTILDTGAPGDGVRTLSDLFTSSMSFLRRRIAVVICCLVLALACGAVYLFTTPPRYPVEAMLFDDGRPVTTFEQQAAAASIFDSPTVDSEVELIKSENVALAVVKKLHLIQDPAFVNPRSGLIPSLIGKTLRFVTALWLSNVNEDESPEEHLTRAAISEINTNLTVKRVESTYVISIKFESYSPERAAQVANAIADAYIMDKLEAKYQNARRAGVWLQERSGELREQAMAAERAVETFKEQNNIVDAGGRPLSQQELAVSNSQLSIAKVQTAEAKARLGRINDVVASGNIEATVTDTLNNAVITRLREQYFDIAARQEDWSARYGVSHLATIDLRNQMAVLRKSILEELKRIAETYKSEFEIAKGRQDSLEKSLADVVSQTQVTAQAQVTLRNLESAAETYRALHDNFLQRYTESVQQQSFPINEARIITPATRPLEKDRKPRPIIVIAASLCGGLFLGVGFGMLRDFSDRRFRTSGQVERIIHASLIATFPVLKTSELPQPKVAPQIKGSVRTNRKLEIGSRALMRSGIDDPFSSFAEAVRATKLAIDLKNECGTDKVIAFTSAIAKEGKSTVASAVAQYAAHSGARVILIDGDLRNPSLTQSLAPQAMAGLFEVLCEKVLLQDALLTDPSTELIFLPLVLKSRILHPTELFGSDATKGLIAHLRREYDYVFVDLSPLAPVADVRATTQWIDSFILVVEWGRTRIETVEQALHHAGGVCDKLVGVVFNKADLASMRRYDGCQEYYSRYHGKYGQGI